MGLGSRDDYINRIPHTKYILVRHDKVIFNLLNSSCVMETELENSAALLPAIVVVDAEDDNGISMSPTGPHSSKPKWDGLYSSTLVQPVAEFEHR